MCCYGFNLHFPNSFWRRQWHPTPVLLPGKSHGRRSLVGCSPWGHEESDRLSDFTFPFHFHALEKEMATHSSVLAWRIPGTGEPAGLPSMGSHRVGHDWGDLAAAAADQHSESDHPPHLHLQQFWFKSPLNYFNYINLTILIDTHLLLTFPSFSLLPYIMFFSVLEPGTLQRIRPHTSTLLQQGSFTSQDGPTHALFFHQVPQSQLNPHLITIVSN